MTLIHRILEVRQQVTLVEASPSYFVVTANGQEEQGPYVVAKATWAREDEPHP